MLMFVEVLGCRLDVECFLIIWTYRSAFTGAWYQGGAELSSSCCRRSPVFSTLALGETLVLQKDSAAHVLVGLLALKAGVDRENKKR